jgi:hypothetical protein
MCDDGLQQLINMALIDEAVLEALLTDPLSLADRFALTVPERRFVERVRARDLEHFAALVEDWSNGKPPTSLPMPVWRKRRQRAG